MPDTNYNERIVHVSLSVNDVELLDHLLAVEQQRAMRLDELDHADRCSDLAARLNGAVPAAEVVAAPVLGSAS